MDLVSEERQWRDGVEIITHVNHTHIARVNLARLRLELLGHYLEVAIHRPRSWLIRRRFGQREPAIGGQR
jgi:hypothetical protein